VTSADNRSDAEALRSQAARIAEAVAGTVEQVAVSEANGLSEGRRIRLLISLTSLQGVCLELLDAADSIDPREER
jgi:hypothetical protein